jgi:hypothetical protein
LREDGKLKVAMRTPFVRLPLQALTASCLIAAAMLIAPADVHATCGDYVMVAHAKEAPNQDSPRPLCHGPGCSGMPTVPGIPMSLPVRSATESQMSAMQAAVSPNEEAGSDWLRAANPDRQPSRRTSSIFHPPRAGLI